MIGLQAVFMIFLHNLFLSVKVNHCALHDIYIGCFRAFGNQKDISSAFSLQVPLSYNEITVENCIDACIMRNYTYAGVQRDSCFCGDEFEGQLPEKTCQAECPGNKSQLCGGSHGHSHSVYAVCAIGYYGLLCDKVCHCQLRAVCNRTTGLCPNGCDRSWQGRACDEPYMSTDKMEWYVGCYDDGNPKALDVKNPDGKTGAQTRTNTIQFCREICANFNYTYLGTQYSYECNCGERYDRYGQGKYQCGLSCTNNSNQVCGGYFANSVYSVCPTGCYAQNCLSRCNCLNNSRCVYRNGSCANGCKSGWSGNSCSIRDCQDANGDCSGVHEICEIVDLKYATVKRCGCMDGYNRKRPWEVCSDTDECSDPVSACGADAYNCTNTDGGFWCSYCSEGLHNVNGSCINIDIEDCKCFPTTGIILATLLAISLLINVVFVVSRIESAKSRKTEPSKGVSEGDFKSGATEISDQHRINYDEISGLAGQSVYEQINQQQRQLPTSEYAELKHDDYVNAECSI